MFGDGCLAGWEGVWDVLNATFGELASSIERCHEGVSWTIAHHETESSPFTGYGTFDDRGSAGEEHQVLTVAVQRKGDRLSWTSDLATGEGAVLLEGPFFEVPEDRAGDLFGEPLASTIAFVQVVEPTVLQLLPVGAVSRANRRGGARPL
jgi:hypothetical protein